jgi:hypothetical protein
MRENKSSIIWSWGSEDRNLGQLADKKFAAESELVSEKAWNRNSIARLKLKEATLSRLQKA